MSITLRDADIQREIGLVLPLIHAHGLEAYGPSVNVNLSSFMLLARNGQIQTFVLCDGPKIVGYSLWITSFDMMFAHHNRADEVALYVMPEYRGRPSIRLMRYAEMRLRDMGYTRLARAAKKDSKLHTTLLGLGYGKEEIIVFKEF